MAKKTEFTFNLSEPIEIAKDGKTEPCDKLLLRAPAFIHRKYSLRIKQSFLRAINNLPKTEQKADEVKSADEAITAESIAGLLLMSDIDIIKVFDDFEALLLSKGICFVSTDKVMTERHYEQLADEDIDLLLGEYIVNFLIPSWMRRQMKK